MAGLGLVLYDYAHPIKFLTSQILINFSLTLAEYYDMNYQ